MLTCFLYTVDSLFKAMTYPSKFVRIKYNPHGFEGLPIIFLTVVDYLKL